MESSMMKTQISVLVKKESILSQMNWKLMGHPFSWFLYVFRKPSAVCIWIDKDSGNPQFYELTPKKEPYLIELDPGYHEMVFEDENADSKEFGKFWTRLAASIAIGGFVHGMADEGGLDTAINVMAATSGATIRDGAASFTLQPGDLMKFSCKPTRKGSVKVKLLS